MQDLLATCMAMSQPAGADGLLYACCMPRGLTAQDCVSGLLVVVGLHCLNLTSKHKSHMAHHILCGAAYSCGCQLKVRVCICDSSIHIAPVLGCPDALDALLQLIRMQSNTELQNPSCQTTGSCCWGWQSGCVSIAPLTIERQE